MPNCSNCSAPLPVGGIRCEYCGSRNDVDLQGVHYYTTHETDTERTCPRCATGLKTVDLKLQGRFLIERCDDCMGLFFDPGELEAVLDAAVKNVFTVDRSQLGQLNRVASGAPEAISYIRCPVCATVMNRVNFGTRSGVVVDRCREHGIWLDGGELRRLCEWMKAGGRLLDQERQEQRKLEAAVAEKLRLQRDRSAAGDTDTAFDLFSGSLKQQDPDLFDIVFRALRLFTR